MPSTWPLPPLDWWRYNALPHSQDLGASWHIKTVGISIMATVGNNAALWTSGPGPSEANNIHVISGAYGDGAYPKV